MTPLAGTYVDRDGTEIRIRQTPMTGVYLASWRTPSGRQDSERLTTDEVRRMLRARLMTRKTEPS